MNLILLIIIIVVLNQFIKRNNEKKSNLPGEDNGSVSWNKGRGPAAGGRVTASSSYERQPVSARRQASTVSQATGSKPTTAAKLTAQAKTQISTTEYLEQKAKADEREHARQARQEAMRLQREAGGRKAALRYLDGDSTPRDMRIERCHYCGAANLLPRSGRRQDYVCYFCREDL